MSAVRSPSQVLGSKAYIAVNAVRSVFLVSLLFAIVFGLVFAGACGYHFVLLSKAAARGAPPIDSAEIFFAIFRRWHIHLPEFAVVLTAAKSTFQNVLPVVTTCIFGWISFAYVLNRMMINSSSGARIVNAKLEPRFATLTEALVRKAGMDMPQLAIIETDESNAFASGMSKSQYTVAVTRGLLRKLNDRELSGVIAHELAHIRNHDVRLMVIAGTIAGAVGFLAEILFGAISRVLIMVLGGGSDDEGGFGPIVAFLVGFLLVVFSSCIAILTNFALSRQREFLADAGAAEITGDPDALISALKKITTDDSDFDAPASVMRMCIDNPRRHLFGLLSTHPDPEARIAALEAMPRTVQVREKRSMTGRTAQGSLGGARVGFGRRSLA